MIKKKVVIILGPTAVGKTSLSINLAKKYSGEIISADSRQIYKGLDIASGKVTKEEMQGIPHHLLDILEIGRAYSAHEFRQDAQRLIAEIHARGNTPFIVGGTGFFIATLVYGWQFPEVPPNEQLRQQLDSLTTDQLWQRLHEVAGGFAARLKPQQHNRHRLIRALEIAEAGQNVEILENHPPTDIDFLQIGLELSRQELRQRIAIRSKQRLDAGLLQEIASLLDKGISETDIIDLGFEMQLAINSIKGRISQADFIEQLITKDAQYAKRQMTWFRRFDDIQWFHPTSKQEITDEIDAFLKS